MPAVNVRYGLKNLPRTEFGEGFGVRATDIEAGALTGAVLSVNQSVRRQNVMVGTIATTGSGEVISRAPITGAIATITFTAKDALAANNTNFLTFTSINKGTGAGSTALLTAVAANTTQLTGGQAIVAYTPLVFALGATLAVTGGDVLTFAWSATGTLANQVTEGVVTFVFTSTT